MTREDYASIKGKQFAQDHPYADGATVAIWASRMFETGNERLAFIRGWQKEAGVNQASSH